MILIFGILITIGYTQSEQQGNTLELQSYDQQLATKLFYLAAASYCNQKQIQNWSCGKPCEKTKQMLDITIFINQTKDNSGYSGYDPISNEIIVVFRGTLPWFVQNIIEDIDTTKVDYPYCNNGCQVHRGFYNAFIGIQYMMLDSVQLLRAKYPTAIVSVTGHSLGASIATHALVFLVHNKININHFYTFGSPRMADKAFFEWLNLVHYPNLKIRVTHSRDPVPHRPRKSNGFHHVNTEVFYENDFNEEPRICEDSTDEDPLCADSHQIIMNYMDHCSYMGFNVIMLYQCQL